MQQDPKGQQAVAPLPPTQGPQQFPSTIGAPRLPQEPTRPVSIGEDSPPILGLMRNPMGQQPPAAATGWMPPDVIPEDHVEATAVLQRLWQELQLDSQRQWHEYDLSIQQGVDAAPGAAEDLIDEMRRDPEARDYGGDVETLRPYLPPSRHKHLSDTSKRIREGRKLQTDFEKELRAKLTEEHWKDVKPDDEYGQLEKRLAELKADELKPIPFESVGQAQGQLEEARAFREKWDRRAQGLPDQPEQYGPRQPSRSEEMEAITQRMGQLKAEGAKGTGGVGLKDLVSGALEPLGMGDATVADSMTRIARGIIDEKVEGKPVYTRRGLSRWDLSRDESTAVKPPPGWSKETLRAALTDAAIGTIGNIKRDTTGADLTRQAASVVTWLPVGIGEVKLSAKLAQQLPKLSWLAKSPKLLKAAEAVTTYAAGPAALEGTYGYFRPLQQEQQAELETIEDGDRRSSVETAYRVLNATRDAATSVLFAFSDVSQAFRGLKLGERTAGQVVADAAKIGLIAPAAVDTVNEVAGEAAKKLADGEGGAADVIRDMHAAKGLYGPTHALVENPSWETLKAYALAATPMAAGITAAHVAATVPNLMLSRKEMLEARRMMEDSIDKLDLDEAARDVMRRDLGKKLEAKTMSHADDERARIRADIVAERAEGRVKAEDLADRILVDIPGSSLPQRVARAQKEADQPGLPPQEREAALARRDLAESVADVAAEESAAKASVMAAVAEREAQVVKEPPAETGRAVVRSDQLAEIGTKRKLQIELLPGNEPVKARYNTMSTGVDGAGNVTVTAGGLSGFRMRFAKEAFTDAEIHRMLDEPGGANRVVEEVLEEAGYPLSPNWAKDGKPLFQVMNDVARAVSERRLKIDNQPTLEKLAERQGMAEQVRLAEDPAALDAPTKRVHADLTAEWQLVSRDKKKKLVTLSRVDENGQTIRQTVPAKQLKRYKLAPKTPARPPSPAQIAAREKLAKAAKSKPTSMLTRIRQLGGIGHGSWGDPATKTWPGEIAPERRKRMGGVFRGRGKGGMPWDYIAGQLRSEGYGPPKAADGDNADHSWFVEALDAESAASMYPNLVDDRHGMRELQAQYEEMERTRGEQAAQEMLEAKQPVVVDDMFELAKAAAQQGMLSSRTLAKAIGVGKTRANELLNQLQQAGVVERAEDGKGFKLASAEPTRDVVTEDEARDIDAAGIREELLEGVDEIGRQFEETGESAYLVEHSKRLASAVADFGDAMRPDDADAAEAASMHLVASMLIRMPEKARTPDTMVLLGIPENAHDFVRTLVETLDRPRGDAPPAPDPSVVVQAEGVPATMTPEQAARHLRTDLSRATKGPTLDAVHERVQAVHKSAVGAGKSERDAAAETFAEFARDERGLSGMTHDEFVTTRARHVEAIHDELLNATDHDSRNEAIEALGDLVNGWNDTDGETAMLSLTAEGRAVLDRVQQLWHAVTTKQEVTDMTPLALPGGDKPRRARTRRRAGDRKPDESGFLDVSAFGSVLVGTGRAAVAIMRGTQWSLRRLFRGTMRAFVVADRALTAPIRWPIDAAWNALSKNRPSKLVRVARAVAERASTVHGKYAGFERSRAGKAFIDQLSQWDEVDLVFAYEKAAGYARLAEDAMGLLHKELLREDSDVDLKFNEWLRVTGKHPDERTTSEADFIRDFDSTLTPRQREIASAVRTMYQSLRELVAKNMLPAQVLRKRHIKLLQELSVERQGTVDEMHEALQAEEQRHDDLVAQLKAAGKKKLRDLPEWKESQRQVRAARYAHSRAVELHDEVSQRLTRLHEESGSTAAKWGITDEGYAPHVLGVDRQTLEQMKMPDLEQLVAEQAATARELEQKARDMVWNPIMAPPQSGYWKTRTGALERMGLREQSGLRTFFHYVRELYRLLPASRWYDQNLERVFGELQLVKREELELGELNEGGAEVEWISDEAAPTVRSDTRYRLGGSAYELKLVSSQGRDKSVWFRRYDDLQKAAAGPLDQLVGPSPDKKETWAVSEKQNYGKRIILLPSAASATGGPSRRARLSEQELRGEAPKPLPEDAEIDASDYGGDDIAEDRKSKRLVFNPDTTKFLWPLQAIGRVAKRSPGKYQRIAAEHGRARADEFARYVHRSLQQVMGRELLTMGQKAASSVASMLRHRTIGLLNLKSALKEITDTTFANGLIMGMDRSVEATGWASEFGERLDLAKRQLAENPAEWLKAATPDPDTGEIVMQPLVDGVATPKDKLQKLGPKARAEREMLDEAYQQFLRSWLSADSIMEHYGRGTRDFQYGERLHLEAKIPQSAGEASRYAKQLAGAAGRATGKVSWAARRQAQAIGMRATWIGAYMSQRRAGVGAEDAFRIANEYALAQGNVGNRVAQSEAFQTAMGQLIKPLASWNAAVSATNWRYFVQAGAKKAVSRLAYYFAAAYVVQQVGQLFGVDFVQSLGGGVGQIPLIGPSALWSIQKLQSMLGVGPDPADAAAQLPQWRRDAQKGIADQEWIPTLLREWLVRRAGDVGGFPADVPIPPFWGTWSPYVFESSKQFYEAAQAAWIGDKRKAQEKAWQFAIGSNFWAQLYQRINGTQSDPSDPSYALVTHPVSGVTIDRIKKGNIATAIWNSMLPDLETSIERVRRSIIQPQRDAMQAAETRSTSFEAQRAMIRATQLRQEAERATGPAKATMLEMAAEKEQLFRQLITEHAEEHNIRGKDLAALARRWRRAAESNMRLTSGERDIINAYDNETAFRLFAHALNDVTDPMPQDRFRAIIGMWYSSTDELKQALRGVPAESRQLFLDAMRTAQTRWKATTR